MMGHFRHVLGRFPRVATGLTALFALSPDPRFGYLIYPVALYAWPRWPAARQREPRPPIPVKSARLDWSTTTPSTRCKTGTADDDGRPGGGGGPGRPSPPGAGRQAVTSRRAKVTDAATTAATM
jgi:hypothetical protein